MAIRFLLTGFLALALGGCESFGGAFGGGGGDRYGGTAYESGVDADEDGFASSDGSDDCSIRRGGSDGGINYLVCN